MVAGGAENMDNDFTSFAYSDLGPILGFEGTLSSQSSQQSDYLRNVDLGVDVDEFELSNFLQDIRPIEPDDTAVHFEADDDHAESCLLTPTLDNAINFEELDELKAILCGKMELDSEATKQSPEPTIFTVDVDGSLSDEASSPESVIPLTSPLFNNFGVIVQGAVGSEVFSDDYLGMVKTKEFNRRIQQMHLSFEEVKYWKRKRRTLKNRGYAQSSRCKRIGQHQELEEENASLRLQLKRALAEREKLFGQRERILVQCKKLGDENSNLTFQLNNVRNERDKVTRENALIQEKYDLLEAAVMASYEGIGQ